MKFHMLIILIVFFLSSCNNDKKNITKINIEKINSNKMFDTINIEKNFEIKNIDELQNKFEKIYTDKNRLIPYDVMSDTFFYPINKTIYSNSFIENKFYAGYRIKISENIWILAYLYNHDLLEEEVIWSIYDSNTKKIYSNLVIAGWNTNVDRKIKNFDGKNISIDTKYKRHLENGMEGDNSKPIELNEIYEISKDYKFIKME